MNGPPFWILVLCLAMPLLYSLPTALISAELATNYPETGGQCVYVTLACGSLIGAHNTWWVWFSTAVDAGTYPQFIQQSIQTQFEGKIPDVVCDYIPLMVIAFITTINLLGVDWLMRFEIFLGAMAVSGIDDCNCCDSLVLDKLQCYVIFWNVPVCSKCVWSNKSEACHVCVCT